MGGCFSSASSRGEEAAAAHGGCGRPQRRVRPSDEDGDWPLAGRRTVDAEADVYIRKFHQYQSSCCADHAALAPPTPAPSLAPATATA